MGTLRALARRPPGSAEAVPGKRKPSPAKEDQGATTAVQLDHVLFEPWSYTDPRPSLRWDPVNDRRYALRAFDPTNASASPILTVRGPTGLPSKVSPGCRPSPATVMQGREASRRNRAVDFTWPIWNCWLRADTVRSMLSLDELYDDKPKRTKLEPRGIVEIFRSRRSADTIATSPRRLPA